MTHDDPQIFVRIARQLEQERTAAKPAVARLRGSVRDEWESEIPVEWRNAGFVQELTAAASEVLEQNALTSMLLARFAIAIVSSIPKDAYASPVLAAAEGAAWKELANGHRYLSEYEAAIRALDAADRCLESVYSLTYDRAVVDLARALVFCDMGRFDDARSVLRNSADVFAGYEDHRRTGQCLLLDGMIEHRRGALADACDTYARAVRSFRKTDDLHSLASVYNNLAQARLELGDTTAAASALHDAIAIFTDLGEIAELLRTKWVLGRILLVSGRYQRARDLLLEARNAFRGMGMLEEAGLAGLELVETFLALGSMERAQAVTEEVLADFQQAHLNDRTATALAYLRDAVATPHGREAVRHVKTYIETLKRQPLQLFAPPPEGPPES